MRRIAFLLALFSLAALAAPAVAHDEEASGGGFHDDVVANLERTGRQLVALAEATPAEQFGWAPNDQVRTVSEVYMHVVGTNLLLPSALGAAPAEGVVVGEEGPFALMQEWEATVTAKEDVIAKLQESMAYAAAAVREIQDLDTEVTLFGPPASKRSYVLILLAHAHEHLGQSIAYARSIGVVPPWSRPLPSGDGETGDSGEGGGEGR